MITPEEFKARLGEFLQLDKLKLFFLNQRTKELVIVADVNMEVRLENPPEWQWDLWCAKEVPNDPENAIPAQSGWILLRYPYLAKDKLITVAEVGCQPVWLAEDGQTVCTNESLKELFKRCKKLMTKKDKMYPVKEAWNNNGPVYNRKLRCSNGALALQKSGTHFTGLVEPGSQVIYMVEQTE
jgi:hypothetical protein